jgi:hypothetical protein
MEFIKEDINCSETHSIIIFEKYRIFRFGVDEFRRRDPVERMIGIKEQNPFTKFNVQVFCLL